jgi:hypothetical protein
MSQNSNLDQVIRLITLEEATTLRQKMNWTEAKIIRVDMKKAQILPRKPLMGLRRYIRYYRVSTENSAEAGAQVTIKDFSSNLSVEMRVSYQVKCPPGNEEKVVLALYKGDNPTTVLNRLIETLVQDFAALKRGEGVNPVLEYFQYREELKKYLVKNIMKKTGLEIEMIIALAHEKDLETFTIKSGDFDLRVNDCDDEMKLKFEIGLAVSNENRVYAILEYPNRSELETFLKDHIKKYALENIPLHDFAYDLNYSVKQKLIVMLNHLLEKKGREVAWLRLEGKTGTVSPQDTMKLQHTVSCDIKDYSKKIEVEHKLLMQLEDIGKYKAKQPGKDLKEWVEEKLNEITQNALFEKRYVDILLDFEKPEQDQETLKTIKQDMQNFAGAIGYTVKHLIVEPNMKPLIVKRDGFMVQKTGDFSTLNNKVNVKLDIVVTGNLRDLSKIPQYITPEKDIIVEMEQVIYNEGEKQMHSVDPEKFYMPFKFPDEESIEDMLKIGIKERLESIFFASDVNVIIKRLETDLLQRILNLINGNPYNLDIEVMPLRGGGAQEKVAFEVEFLVETVSRWNTFIYKNFESHTQEIEKVKDALQKDISEKFQTVPYEILRYISTKDSRTLLEIARKSHSKITIIFGLDIKISYVKRKPIKAEEAQQKILEKKVQALVEIETGIIGKEKEAILEKVDKLQEIELKYLNPEYSEEEPKDYAEKELEKIKNKAKESNIDGTELFKLTAPESSKNWSPDEYKDEFADESKPLPPKQDPEKLENKNKN